MKPTLSETRTFFYAPLVNALSGNYTNTHAFDCMRRQTARGRKSLCQAYRSRVQFPASVGDSARPRNRATKPRLMRLKFHATYYRAHQIVFIRLAVVPDVGEKISVFPPRRHLEDLNLPHAPSLVAVHSPCRGVVPCL